MLRDDYFYLLFHFLLDHGHPQGQQLDLCSAELNTGASISKRRDEEKVVEAGTEFLALSKENGAGGNSKSVLSSERAPLGTFLAPDEPPSN